MKTRDPGSTDRWHGWLQGLAVLATVLLLGACASAWQNTRPAQDLARQREGAGSVYTGWRVFQDKCVACHGPAGNGTSAGPDLLPRMRDMGPRRFVALVLKRYDWSVSTVQGSSESAAREALIDDVLQGRQGTLTMPAWEGEPRVNAHIADLYAYLSARAEGTQGPGRPAP